MITVVVAPAKMERDYAQLVVGKITMSDDEDEVITCDICGEETADAERITDENWEYCTGLEKQFCGECRVDREEPPCDDPECEADVCYDARTADTTG